MPDDEVPLLGPGVHPRSDTRSNMPVSGVQDDPEVYIYVRAVAELPPIEGLEEASDPAWLLIDDDGRPADWKRVAEVSVQAARERASWTLHEWSELARREFRRPLDRYTFRSLLHGVMIGETIWYNGRHRAAAQIAAGATEIICVEDEPTGGKDHP